MADTNVSIKAKSKAVTSSTTTSRQTFPALPNTTVGLSSVTSGSAAYQKEAEKMRDVLAMVKDVLNNWPCRTKSGQMPKPYISSKFGILTIALPVGRHVIENIVTSDGLHDFDVDGIPVMPADVTVTSES